MPHLAHTKLMIFIAAAGVGIWTLAKSKKRETLQQSLLSLSDDSIHAISLELTFARIHTFEPPVINVSVAGTPTVLKPSTARSATTESAGFTELAAFWARHRVSDR